LEDRGEEKRHTIPPEFDPLDVMDFQEAKIT
jgi:hypothetical protein